MTGGGTSGDGPCGGAGGDGGNCGGTGGRGGRGGGGIGGGNVTKKGCAYSVLRSTGGSPSVMYCATSYVPSGKIAPNVQLWGSRRGTSFAVRKL